MEQHFLETLSKFSTSHLLILLAAYSVGRITTYLITVKKAAYRGKVVRLEAEVARLKKQVGEEKHASTEKAD